MMHNTTLFRHAPHSLWPIALVLLVALSGCGLRATPTPEPVAVIEEATATPSVPPVPPVPPTMTPVPTIPEAARGYVPILCYHQIREWTADDTEEDRAYIMPPSGLAAQLAYLRKEGYHGVSAAQVYAYYAFGQPLPAKPIMLSFDDNDGTQYTVARPLLQQYGFSATFFIMTVTVGKKGYMSAAELQQLDREGFDIQPHTWDHHMVTKYKTERDWKQQIVEPRQYLEALLGHPTPFFAYPFGIYDAASAQRLKAFNYQAAFRLRENMDPNTDPLFAIERRIANPYWTHEQFLAALRGGE